MDKMSSDETPGFSLIEKILAYAAISIIAIAVVTYLVTLIVGLADGRYLLANGLWPLVAAIGFYGLPIGFLLLFVLLIISFTRRARAARRAGRK